MDGLVEKYNKKRIVSEIYSLEDVKQDMDDLLCEYLAKVGGYASSTFITSVRIGIGALAILGSAALWYFSRFWKLEEYRAYALAITGVYFGFTYAESILTQLFCSYTFDGRNARGERIRALSKLDSPCTHYIVLLYFRDREIPSKLSLDIRTVYDPKGVLDHQSYLKMLRDAVEKDGEGAK